MKDVEKFEKLLTKICKDLKINNYKELVDDFLKEIKGQKNT